MKVGTRSLLFGVHHFLIHPIFVFLAWVKLYGTPSWREVICIIIHDWGYFGKVNIDGIEGETHPELGANIAQKLFGEDYAKLCLYHSRHYAKKYGAVPSKLCWADKFSISYELWWFYLLRAHLGGEIAGYREYSNRKEGISYVVGDREWFVLTQKRMMEIGQKQEGVQPTNLEILEK